MPSPSRRRILVAEDNESARMIMCDLCRIFGYEVDGVTNGLEAVEACARTQYDLVLMDCQMPVMGGLDATRRIRAAEGSESRRRTVIIAVTGDGNPEQCIAAGMDDYLPKPTRPVQFRTTISRWLEPKRTSQITATSQLTSRT
jgi:CheY-like chemotaxis protein